MKLKEFFYCLGLKPRPQSYGFEVHEQSIDNRTIRYAQWLHPRAYRGEISATEITRLKRFLREGDVAIDIGAHTGDTTLPMAMAVGSTGSVIAFEANKFVYPTLKVNATLNRSLGAIYAYNLAVTEENREYEFSYNDPGFMNGGAVEKTRQYRRGDAFRQMVQGVRLVDFLNENFPEFVNRIRYIKIDTEGSDLYILKSIAELIDRVQPIIQAEVMRRTPADYRLEMFDFLTQRGYQIQLHVGGLDTGRPMVRNEILQGDDFDLFCTPRSQAASGAKTMTNVA